jgi:hypothetical protein
VRNDGAIKDSVFRDIYFSSGDGRYGCEIDIENMWVKQIRAMPIHSNAGHLQIEATPGQTKDTNGFFKASETLRPRPPFVIKLLKICVQSQDLVAFGLTFGIRYASFHPRIRQLPSCVMFRPFWPTILDVVRAHSEGTVRVFLSDGAPI